MGVACCQSGLRRCASRHRSYNSRPVFHRRTRPIYILQRHYHATRSAVSTVSFSGKCAYRRKVCLTSGSCVVVEHRTTAAVRADPRKMSCRNIYLVTPLPVLVAKYPNKLASGPTAVVTRPSYRCGPVWKGLGSAVLITAVKAVSSCVDGGVLNSAVFV